MPQKHSIANSDKQINHNNNDNKVTNETSLTVGDSVTV